MQLSSLRFEPRFEPLGGAAFRPILPAFVGVRQSTRLASIASVRGSRIRRRKA